MPECRQYYVQNKKEALSVNQNVTVRYSRFKAYVEVGKNSGSWSHSNYSVVSLRRFRKRKKNQLLNSALFCICNNALFEVNQKAVTAQPLRRVALTVSPNALFAAGAFASVLCIL